ncbi:type II toxin-antitoxin system RelE/ParE family toxin [Ferruginibacter sp.]|jgi:plasmid stabilization system protein ParE
MGRRKIIVKQTAADNIAAIAWFIESKGMIATADKFTDDVYDAFLKLADERKSFSICREPERAALGYKCIPYKKKYTIVLIESDKEVIICEFISSKLIYW